MSGSDRVSGENDTLSVHAPSDGDTRDPDVAQALRDNKVTMERILKSLEAFNDRGMKQKWSPSSSSSSSSSSPSSDSSRQNSRSPSPQPNPPKRKGKGLKQVKVPRKSERDRSPSSDSTTATLEARLLSRHGDLRKPSRQSPTPTQTPSASSSNQRESEEIRNSIFNVAGQEFEEDEDTSGPVSEELAEFIHKIFSKTGKGEKLREKAKLYSRPDNCPGLGTPLTNPEIWAVLKGSAKRIDTKLTAIQNLVGKSAVAVAQCADELAKSDPALTKRLIDALALLGHAHKCLTLQRKDRQKYALPSDIRAICDPSVEENAETSKFLYGDDVKKALKEAKESKRLTSSLKADYTPYSFKRRSANNFNKPGRPFLDHRGYSQFPKWKSQGPAHKRGHNSQYRRRKQLPPQ
ncbi:uncharacterized protein LOC106011106 [Aplysia californica]|uniref:Uncharacterized protein LOC106011106 n=1 Tax=Aplysia californica TaxID=6500 RepID=A0ABM0ZUY7_APLCA|nr:uncharacterized protein LOC106011106 [Aplysia californica]